MSCTVTMLNGYTYEVKSETRTVNLTAEELNAIQTFALHNRLRNAIIYVVEHMIEDEDLDMNDYPYTKDELIDEIYIDYEDKLDADEIAFPNDDEIFDSVVDLIDFYVANK